MYVDGDKVAGGSADISSLTWYYLGNYKTNTSYKFQGDYLLHRHFNYALSDDEVKALYNNGDPMGYVVPKLYRQFGPDIEPSADTFEFNIGSPYGQRITPIQQYPFECIYKVEYVVDEWDYQPKTIGTVGFLGINGADILTSDSNGWTSIDKAKVGELRSLLVKMPASGTPMLYIYGGNDNEETTARRLKVTINSIIPVGILAEYLPQNLMGEKEKPLQIIGENSYTWENVTTVAPTLDIRTNPSIKTGVIYRVNLTVSGFIEGEPYLYAGSRVSIPSADGTYDLLVTPSGNYDYISVYGGTNIQLKNLTITVNKVEIANATTSWLDSAKQLPLSDEYMEPLFQSIGGHDMAANGAPEILYNE